jgi:hypothetical protein
VSRDEGESRGGLLICNEWFRLNESPKGGASGLVERDGSINVDSWWVDIGVARVSSGGGESEPEEWLELEDFSVGGNCSQPSSTGSAGGSLGEKASRKSASRKKDGRTSVKLEKIDMNETQEQVHGNKK